MKKILIAAGIMAQTALAQNAMLESLWDSGFPAAKEIDGKIDKGEAWVWSSAVQLVNGKTKKEVFTKLTQLEAGQPVALSHLPRAEKSLLRLGYYEKAGDAKLYRVANRNRLVPAFSVRDAAASSAEASLAYDAQTRENSGYIAVQLLNISGTARDFSLAGENSGQRRSAEIAYKEPFILGAHAALALRGAFSEDSLAKQKNASIEYIRKLGWEWQYAAGGGRKNGRANATLAVAHDSRDKAPLPFSGLRAEARAELSALAAGELAGENYQPLSKSWTLLLAAKGAGIAPAPSIDPADLQLIGGTGSFKSLAPRSLRTRAYGFSEIALQWHGIEKSALHLFAQQGAYRNQPPLRGWQKLYECGIGWEQGIASNSVAISYAISQRARPIDGLLNMSVKVGF